MAEVLLTCVFAISRYTMSYLVSWLRKILNFLKFSILVEEDTGVPNVGHWPVSSSLRVWKPENFTRIMLDYSKADWKFISSALEVAIQREYPELIKKFSLKFFLQLNDLIQECNKMIPAKTIFTHSKPYWN